MNACGPASRRMRARRPGTGLPGECRPAESADPAQISAPFALALKRRGNGRLAKCLRVQLSAPTAMTSSVRAASAIPLQDSHTRHGATRHRDGTRRTVESPRSASIAKAQRDRAPRSHASRLLPGSPDRCAPRSNGRPCVSPPGRTARSCAGCAPHGAQSDQQGRAQPDAGSAGDAAVLLEPSHQPAP